MINRILNYIRYRRFINQNRNELTNEYNIIIDNLYRLGGVVSLSQKRMDLMRDYREAELDVHQQLDNEVRKYISKLDRYFMQKNLVEFIGLSNVERVADNRVNIVMSYRLMNIVKVANTSRIILLISFLGAFAGFFFGSLFFIPGGSLFLLTLIFNKMLFNKLFV
jgi:hypothetical protein